MKKRALSLIATLCLLFALLPTAAFAEDVGKITPYIESVTANPITYGQTLADSSIQGSVYSDSTKQTAVEGSFIWENETIKPTAKDDSNTTLYTVIFKPTDTATYNEAKAQITITVNKAQNAPNMPDSAMSVLYSIRAVFMADLPENWRWQDSDRREALEVEVAKKATAMYNGADKGNYINESIEITITRTDCPEHVAGEIRYDGPFDYMPDCWMDGNGHRECTKCGEILEQVRVPAGHVDANKDHICDREECKATISTCSGGTATCKDPANCEYCGKPYGEIDSRNHAVTEVRNAKNATCTEAGYTGDTYCKDCGTKLQDGKPITKLGHIDADKNHVCDRENCKATISTCSGGTATCKDKAVCDYCGKPYGELNGSTHAGGTYIKNDKAATCNEDGYTGDTYCKGCETKLQDGKPVTKLGHIDADKNHVCDRENCKATISGHSFGEDGKCECGAVQYTVTFDPNGGTVDPTSATTDVEGKLTELPTPTRSGSYRFDGWFTEKNGGTAVTVDTVYEAHTTVYAHWTYTGSTTPDYCVIKAAAGEGGSITPSGRAAVLYGASKTFTITPNDGYAIADVKVDGKSVGAVKTYTFERVRGDHTIEAVFMKATGNPQTGVDVPFTDVSENDWFYEDVAYVYANDLMKGTSETTFSPAVTTTRGMIVTILYRLEGEPTVSDNCPFEDVKSGSYYEKAITWAAANEIVGGYGNGKFGPDDPITREQMAVILYRYTQYKGMDVSVGEDTNILSYNDAQEISEYAFSAMQWACGESILNGSDGNLMPQGNATRAQVAAILHRFCENILK